MTNRLLTGLSLSTPIHTMETAAHQLAQRQLRRLKQELQRAVHSINIALELALPEASDDAYGKVYARHVETAVSLVPSSGDQPLRGLDQYLEFWFS